MHYNSLGQSPIPCLLKSAPVSLLAKGQREGWQNAAFVSGANSYMQLKALSGLITLQDQAKCWSQ